MQDIKDWTAKPRKNLGLGCSLLITLITSATFAWAGGTVTGTIKVSGTRLKATGPKPSNDVIVYLEKKGSKDYPPPPKKHAVMDQKSLIFVPHVMAVQKGTTVDFLNSDEVLHNVFCMDDCCRILEPGASKTKYMDLGNWGKGEVRTYTFNLTGTAVLLCKLHPDMEAYIVVLETPYFTQVKVDGESQTATYKISNVPAGQYVLKVWNKKCGAAPQEITVQDGQTVQADLTLTRQRRRH